MEKVKLERINNAFMEQLNIIFGTEIKNPILKKVVVTGVSITNDLSYAKVYFTCFDEDRKEVLKELKESAGFIRGEFVIHLNLYLNMMNHLNMLKELKIKLKKSKIYKLTFS